MYLSHEQLTCPSHVHVNSLDFVQPSVQFQTVHSPAGHSASAPQISRITHDLFLSTSPNQSNRTRWIHQIQIYRKISRTTSDGISCVPLPVFSHSMSGRQKLTTPGPKLTHAQWEICESYGGWTQFLDHYGLKRPWERVQWVEGVKILDIIARRIDAACPESPL
jgi:hypothetical protein